MKKASSTLFIFFVSLNCFAQNIGVKILGQEKKYSVNDTAPIVISENKNEQNILVVINGNPTNQASFSSINPDKIESMDVIKDKKVLDGTPYEGKIVINLKKDYAPKFISVSDFVAKYVQLNKTENYLIKIDDSVINTNYDQTLIDENYIMQIRVLKLNKVKNLENLSVINLISRTQKNVEKANETILR